MEKNIKIKQIKYKIFLDTNQVFNTKGPINEVFSLSIPDIVNFLKEHHLEDVSICLPEIVIRERVQQRLEDIEKNIKDVNEINNSLRKLGHKIEEIVPFGNYRDILEKSTSDFLKKYKVNRIEPPLISQGDLIDRAINKMKPFNDNGAGFKDTLIYLSIVEDALKKDAITDSYIFCTNDAKEFNADVIEEFKKVTDRNLYIVENVAKVKERLDELVPLNLHLKERNKKIQNLILNHSGDFVALVNKNMKPSRSNDLISRPVNVWDDRYVLEDYYPLGFRSQKISKIIGYTYEGIDLLTIDELAVNKYHVSGTLSVKVVYEEGDSESMSNFIHSPVVPNSFDQLFSLEYEVFDFEVDCNLGTGEVFPKIIPRRRFF
jgi:hypothetical protein